MKDSDLVSQLLDAHRIQCATYYVLQTLEHACDPEDRDAVQKKHDDAVIQVSELHVAVVKRCEKGK